MSQLFDLTGNVALCTGAASGIGQRMAIALSQAGADVILVDRQEDALAEAAEAINAEGNGKAAGVVADLLDRDGLVDVVSEAAGYFGAPTILTNAAGVNLRQPYDEITSETWDITLNINLATPFFLARACVPGMLEKGHGKIINIASLQSTRAFANSIPYGASKGGIAQVTRAMAEAWSGQGIMANAIAPGFPHRADCQGLRQPWFGRSQRQDDGDWAQWRSRRYRWHHSVPRRTGIGLHHRTGHWPGRWLYGKMRITS